MDAGSRKDFGIVLGVIFGHLGGLGGGPGVFWRRLEGFFGFVGALWAAGMGLEIFKNEVDEMFIIFIYLSDFKLTILISIILILKTFNLIYQ